MKATDLRIGNYVIFKSIQMVTLNQNGKYENYEEPHQLHQIQISSNDFEYIEKGQSEYRPIPLTEEWLLKFGAKELKPKRGFLKDFVLKTVRIELSNSGNFYYKNSGFILESVHQLQNLYFSLTRKEL